MAAQRKRERPRTTRRAQQRQQQQQRPRPARGGERPWLIPVGATLALLVVAVVLIVHFRPTSNPPQPSPSGTAAASVITELTTLPAATIEQAGAGSANHSNFRSVSDPPLVTDGKPEVLYMGAEYCPYCAAERWALIVALSRFGTFSGLQTLTSSEENVPTFTFKAVSYTSSYLSFVPVELYDGAGHVLQKPTSQQSALLSKYATGYPFVDFGNRSSFDGATYSFTVLTDMTWQQIVNALDSPSSPQAQGILGSANAITAQICKLTGDQPAGVCSSPVIQGLKRQLPG